jgi:hypothetical protein
VKRVLFVDDESNILDGSAACCTRIGSVGTWSLRSAAAKDVKKYYSKFDVALVVKLD